MHVEDDTGKTIGQYGQTTIPECKASFNTTCVARNMQRSIKGEAMWTKIMKKRNASVKQHCISTTTIFVILFNKGRNSSVRRLSILFFYIINYYYLAAQRNPLVCGKLAPCANKHPQVHKSRPQQHSTQHWLAYLDLIKQYTVFGSISGICISGDLYSSLFLKLKKNHSCLFSSMSPAQRIPWLRIQCYAFQWPWNCSWHFVSCWLDYG